eukprot:6285175-Amphidinium_carterae.1
MLPPITPCQVRHAAATYPLNKAVGGDSWTPRHWAHLPQPLIEQMAVMLNRFELELQCPPPVVFAHSAPVQTIWRESSIVTHGCSSPSHTQQTFHYGVTHKDCQFAGWQLSLLHEAARARGWAAASLYLDLQKAFENVSHELLHASAIAHGFPLRLLLASLAIYSAERSNTWRKMCGLVIRVFGTIVAGDARLRI